MADVIRHNQFKISKINYSKPINQQNVYYSSINYNDNKPCYVQSTKLIIEEIKEDKNQKYLVAKVDADDFSFYDLLVKLDDIIYPQPINQVTTGLIKNYRWIF